ncbi:aldehyde dehydrogenase family protein [Paraburkholderia panacisoli]|uniref:Aldehyde dehydrogenase family protein n=1 Tax=Paraburkholderia panacisoli TaxID=2603818 RepID=A0A5B0GXJ5_9BURK|nr:aldehyde dehydrogenase family protein [Paraburkholderia panacisoli]KAA1007657.1 aldehyde dehydrogenase family protein [Paraburkholderia panacisoli]
METSASQNGLQKSFNPGHLDRVIDRLSANKREWARLPVKQRLDLLQQVRAGVVETAQAWALLAVARKGLAVDSTLAGEEWMSGPWAMLTAIDILLRTLQRIDGHRYLNGVKVRRTANGQTAAKVFPLTVTDRLLLSGVSAEVWMEPDVSPETLRQSSAGSYSAERSSSEGRIALVLGAGNITSIAPLDALYKLYAENSVTVVKLNPVTDYLKPIFETIFKPLIDAGYFAIASGGVDVGIYLTTHPLVDTLHITGSSASHDAIIFGVGGDGADRKRQNRPLNNRPITSELGAVCPTIVAPGSWTKADLRFQAEHIATQKLHNSGFNCIAAQILILPRAWPLKDAFLEELRRAFARAPSRSLYYPGAQERLAGFLAENPDAIELGDAADATRIISYINLEAGEEPSSFSTEIFGPALGVVFVEGSDPASFLSNAIAFANDRLHGTLGANVIIDPASEKALGTNFELLLAELRYGCIAVNAWSGLGFLLGHTPWGAFPGHRLNDIQSGKGFVHNGFLFDRPQRSIVRAPFRPFPRGILHGSFALLPRPPWFVTNRTATATARKIVAFQASPSWLKLPGIFFSALRG